MTTNGVINTVKPSDISRSDNIIPADIGNIAPTDVDNVIKTNTYTKKVNEKEHIKAKKAQAYQHKLEQEKKTAIAEANAKSMINTEVTKITKVIKKKSNPSPILFGVIAVCILIVFYVLYLLFVKECLSGIWYDERGARWHIKHNTFSDDLEIYTNGEWHNVKMTNNIFRCNNRLAVWDYKDKIIFLSGGYLTKLK